MPSLPSFLLRTSRPPRRSWPHRQLGMLADGPLANSGLAATMRTTSFIFKVLSLLAFIALMQVTVIHKSGLRHSTSTGDYRRDSVIGPAMMSPQSSPMMIEKREAGVAGGFPHTACSADQLSTVLYQLPSERCIEDKDRPWKFGGECSFSYATRCPESRWLEDFIRKRHDDEAKIALSSSSSLFAWGKSKDKNHHHHDRPSSFTAFYVGCNKGMDAISTLRMGSANTTIDKDAWRTAFFADHQASEIVGGHCTQEFTPQFNIPAGTPPDGKAVVHCIEPVPRNSARLQATANKLGYEDHFHVHAVAISNQDGTAYFARETKLGDEQQAIGGCDDAAKRGDMSGCEAVPVYSLDTSRDVLKDETSMIDFLSIDVEGYDGLVLKGASKTLSRVRYLEFEYNWKGPWKTISLSSTVGTLKEAGFVCYWPGTHRNIWRITDCWLNHYDLKFFSNVACVNVHDPSTNELVQLMERMFQETMEKGDAIRYDNLETTRTNGKRSNPQSV